MNEWISVKDKLPNNHDRKLLKHQGLLAYVEDKDNLYGGIPMILYYGAFEFYTEDIEDEEADDDGMIRKHGWHYERDSEGEYDSLTFEMNGKVTHWMELPDPPSVVSKLPSGPWPAMP